MKQQTHNTMFIISMLLVGLVTIETFKVLGSTRTSLQGIMQTRQPAASNYAQQATSCYGSPQSKNAKQLKNIAKVFKQESDKLNNNNTEGKLK